MFRFVQWACVVASAVIAGCGGSSSGEQGGGSSSGNAYCLKTSDANASSACQGFEGFVDADAEASEVASCTHFGNQSVSACPANPTGCCLENGNTPHGFYNCYYGVPAGMLAVAQTACSMTSGVWQSSVPF
jgi:hypothetical protein